MLNDNFNNKGFVICFEIKYQRIIITFTNKGNLSLNKNDVLMTHYKSDIILSQEFAIRCDYNIEMSRINHIVNVSKSGNKI